MDGSFEVRHLTSADLLVLLYNIWVELHNRLQFEAPGPTSESSGTPGTTPVVATGHTESSVTPNQCNHYCDWCARWCTRHRSGHRHHSCFDHRHYR